MDNSDISIVSNWHHPGGQTLPNRQFFLQPSTVGQLNLLRIGWFVCLFFNPLLPSVGSACDPYLVFFINCKIHHPLHFLNIISISSVYIILRFYCFTSYFLVLYFYMKTVKSIEEILDLDGSFLCPLVHIFFPFYGCCWKSLSRTHKRVKR